MSVITITGAGMMGSAMSVPASDNGHEVRIVGTPLDRDIIDRAKKDGYHLTLQQKLPCGIRYYQPEELTEALDDCDLLIGGVSSFGVEWFGNEVLPKIPKSLPVLSITKGLHARPDGSMCAFPDYLSSKPGCAGLSLNAVGGPCISFELAQRHHTLVAFCGHDPATLTHIRQLLATDYYHIDLSEDVLGIETAVAMKNAYALGVSLAIGLAEAKSSAGCPEEYNPQAALFAQSTREIYRLLSLLGCDTYETLYGAGDLYVTVFGGRTRRLGILLGSGLTFLQASEKLKGTTLESVAITKTVACALMKLERDGRADTKQFPLLMHIYRLICGETTAMPPWEAFI